MGKILTILAGLLAIANAALADTCTVSWTALPDKEVDPPKGLTITDGRWISEGLTLKDDGTLLWVPVEPFLFLQKKGQRLEKVERLPPIANGIVRLGQGMFVAKNGDLYWMLSFSKLTHVGNLKGVKMIDIQKGSTHEEEFLVLKDDGGVWDCNMVYATVGLGSWLGKVSTIPEAIKEIKADVSKIEGLPEITAVAAAQNEFFALDKNGVVWEWGTDSARKIPKPIGGMPPITALAATCDKLPHAR